MMHWRASLAMTTALCAAMCATRCAQPSTGPSSPDVTLSNRQFVVDGRPFLIRGVHYGPWRPGTGPNKAYPYPRAAELEQDLGLLERTHANTILVYDAPGELLDIAERHHLKVLYMFALDWYAVGGPTQANLNAAVVKRVMELRGKPAVLAWLLGNEIPAHALQSRGDATIVNGLRQLYGAVKAADPRHPISHANWPPARRLDLSFLDFTSFNVYPLWPPEVVAMGFGRYLETVLRPIAGDKPLLVSEFGANTIEAGEEGQSRLLRESWEALLGAGAAGGVVFEFADEWWKNYDNPARWGDWWTRIPAPDDELRQDADPEESYGLVRADRSPKPAFDQVAQMFENDRLRTTARTVSLILVSGLVGVAAGSWFWARRRRRRALARAAVARAREMD